MSLAQMTSPSRETSAISLSHVAIALVLSQAIAPMQFAIGTQTAGQVIIGLTPSTAVSPIGPTPAADRATLRALAGLHDRLLHGAVDLPAQAAEVLYGNLWNLYI
jgi:hypothetical protein